MIGRSGVGGTGRDVIYIGRTIIERRKRDWEASAVKMLSLVVGRKE